MNQAISRIWSKLRAHLPHIETLRVAGKKCDHQSVTLAYETLEPRIALAASGLVDVGTQPEGALSGKIVYAHGGHGITGDFPSTGQWNFQRPLLLNMIEDLGNQDQLTFFAEEAFRAGATVVPLRPVGHQPNEIVLDNDDVEVTFSGSWTDSSASIYFGDAGDVPYRFAATSSTETAVATYRPTISAAGFYPVYAWTRSGSDRADDQLYRVNHSGGSTEVTVNHRRVGNGLVYLGTYYFEQGTDGSVEISNRSDDAGSVVIADMIRFGNGVGDVTQGGTLSGRDREDEAALYWIEWHVANSQGISTSEYRATSNDRDATVSASPRYAEYMNRETDGSLSDRVFVSYHSNAGGGRGTVALHNTNQGGATPNQLLLAQLLGQEVNDDLVAQNGQFEHNWSNRGSNVTFQASFNYGEINNSRINNEFDATILETGFHDNQLDAELIRDADVRAAIAKATVQGLVRYFNSVDGGVTQVIMAPAKVSNVHAQTAGADSVTVSWNPPQSNSYNGDAATGYMIYGSTNGYGFDGGTYVDGGATESYTFTGLDPAEGAYYFKVVAVNDGGAGADSEVVAAIPNAGPRDVLIVNGFDRLSRSQNPVQAGAERVRPRESNSFDYAVQVASAIEATSPELVVDTTSNEALLAGEVQLAAYSAVFWILGEESSDDSTFAAAEQSLVSNYLASGGQLFVSGSEIGWDLDNLNNGRSFYNNSLRADYVSDDAGTYAVAGVSGSIFEGLSLEFDDGTQFYDTEFPDVLAASNGSTVALSYVGGTGGGAAVQYDGGDTKLVNLGFPFETITEENDREALMARVLEFFSFELTFSDLDLILDNDSGPSVYSETGDWTTSGLAGFEGGTYRFALQGESSTATWQFFTPFAGVGEVSVQYLAGSNRVDEAVYRIDTGQGIETATINQKLDSFVWKSLGQFDFTAGVHEIVLDAGLSTGGSVVIADVVRVEIAAPASGNADFDADGLVSGFDFLAWQRGFGTAEPTLSQGDANGDSAVDGGDLGIWQSQYGSTSSGLESSAALVAPANLAEAFQAYAQQLSDLAAPLHEESGEEAANFSPQVVDTTLWTAPARAVEFRTPAKLAEPKAQQSGDDSPLLWQRAVDSLFSVPPTEL